MRMHVRAVMIAVVVVGHTALASASVVTFMDRTAWTAALGAAPGFSVDFESFAADTPFATTPVDVGPFTMSTNGTDPAGANKVDVSPFALPPLPPSFGSAAVSAFVLGPLTVDFTFNARLVGFFADFASAGNVQELQLTSMLSGGGTENVSVPGPGTDLQPFGFISTVPITGIRFNNSVNGGS